MATKQPKKSVSPTVKKTGRKFIVVNTPPAYWNPDKEGESVEGTYIHSTERKSQFGMQRTYYIETPQGELGLPSHTVLNNGLSRCKVGDYVKITVTSLRNEKEGQSFNDYVIEKAV